MKRKFRQLNQDVKDKISQSMVKYWNTVPNRDNSQSKQSNTPTDDEYKVNGIEDIILEKRRKGIRK